MAGPLATIATTLALLLVFVASRAEGSTLPEIKLTTSQPGIYRVTAAALAPALGLSSNAVSSLIAQGGFTLLHQGQSLGWLAGPNATELFFHAEAYRNLYTDYDVYWLEAGTNRPPVPVNGGAPAAQTNTYYLASTNIERDLLCEYNLGTHPDSNYWYWTTLVPAISFLASFQDAFDLAAVAPTNVPAQINVRVCGGTTDTHTLTLNVNGTTNAAWTGSWTGSVATNFTFAFPAELLADGTNSVAISAVGTMDQWFINGFELQYPALYLAASGSLIGPANSNAVVTLGGFSNPNITVLDVTQPLAPLLVTNLNVASAAGGWQASFNSAAANEVYSACQAGSERDVAGLEAVWPVGLTSPTNRAALIILAPTNLLAASQPLVAYRNQQGLETKLVSLESVYNEFDYGLREPEAIGDFLAYAWQAWTVPPKYVLFVGNGTYDYRNRLGYGDNLLPPLMIPSLYGLVPSDSAYGLVGSGAALPIVVGRLPVTNSVQLMALINKLETYEQTPAVSPEALLLADLADPAAGDFPADMGQVQATLASGFTNVMILPDNTSSNTAVMRTLLLSNLNSGAELFCYLGHGAAQRLGNSGYLTTSDVPGLTNTTRLPLVSAITCLAGFFAQPGYAGLAQTLTLPANSGAIAVYSASGFSLDSDASELNLGLMANLASGTPGRLGDFLGPAMSEYNQTAHFTPLGMYNLLGDPSLIVHGTPALPTLPPGIASCIWNPAGSFSLTLSAQPGEAYALAATTNLALPMAAWSVLSTGTVPFGTFTLTDSASTNFPRRFYRLFTH